MTGGSGIEVETGRATTGANQVLKSLKGCMT